MSELIQMNKSPVGLNMLQNDEEEFEFIVGFCRDVLLEALLFCDRRRLTKLERIGSNFHRIVENFFKPKPFLRLGLTIDLFHGTFVKGLCHGRISLTEFATFPPFLRFDNVRLLHWRGLLPIQDKCGFFASQLRRLKPGLNDSNLIEFNARISQNYCNQFNDHKQLLDYIRNRFLSVCDSSRGYKFDIRLVSDKNSSTHIIASLLQMNEIKSCSNVEIELSNGEQNQLPVEEILNWLEQSADGMKNIVKVWKKRSLKISFRGTHFIQNAREMVDHLETKFIGAKFSVKPFTFRFGQCEMNSLEIKAQTLINKKTDEELSVSVLVNGEIEIKRVRKERRIEQNLE